MILVRFTEKFEPRPRGLKSESRSMCTGARDPFSNSNLFENNTGSVTGANNKPGSALSVARATKNSAPNRAHRWTNVARFDVRAQEVAYFPKCVSLIQIAWKIRYVLPGAIYGRAALCGVSQPATLRHC